jgi:serine/threonine protein kinase
MSETFKIPCPHCSRRLELRHEHAFQKVVCPACGRDFKVNLPFGNYFLADEVGRDSFSSLHTLVREGGATPLLLRRLLPEFASQPDMRNIFLKTALMLADTKHPALLQPVKVETIEGAPCAHYLMPGAESLKERMAKGAVPLAKALQLMLDVTSLFENLDELGLVHGSLRPSQLRFDQHGNLRVFDLHLGATLLQSARSNGRSERLLIPNRGYAAPEVVRGEAPSRSSDTWSLGAIYFEVLTGRRPFFSARMEDELELCLGGVCDSPRQMNPKIPLLLSDLVMAMMSPKLADRPDHGHILELLQRVMDELESGETYRREVGEIAGTPIPTTKKGCLPLLLLGATPLFWLLSR